MQYKNCTKYFNPKQKEMKSNPRRDNYPWNSKLSHVHSLSGFFSKVGGIPHPMTEFMIEK